MVIEKSEIHQCCAENVGSVGQNLLNLGTTRLWYHGQTSLQTKPYITRTWRWNICQLEIISSLPDDLQLISQQSITGRNLLDLLLALNAHQHAFLIVHIVTLSRNTLRDDTVRQSMCWNKTATCISLGVYQILCRKMMHETGFKLIVGQTIVIAVLCLLNLSRSWKQSLVNHIIELQTICNMSETVTGNWRSDGLRKRAR